MMNSHQAAHRFEIEASPIFGPIFRLVPQFQLFNIIFTGEFPP